MKSVMKKKGAMDSDEVTGWIYAIVVLAVVAVGIYFLWKNNLVPGQNAISRFLTFGGKFGG